MLPEHPVTRVHCTGLLSHHSDHADFAAAKGKAMSAQWKFNRKGETSNVQDWAWTWTNPLDQTIPERCVCVLMSKLGSEFHARLWV